MDEEFLKRFVGKTIAIVHFGVPLTGGILGKAVSVEDGILRISGPGGSEGYFDVDGIYAVLPEVD